LAQSPDAGTAPLTITTDRPAVTDSSAVVPSGAFQAENGLLETGNQGQWTLDFPETLIRVGIAPGTELRFTAPDYFSDSLTSAGLRSGFGDLSLGVKQQLHSGPDGFEVAAIVTLSFPTGAAAISSHGYDPSPKYPGPTSSHQIGPRQVCSPSMCRPWTAPIEWSMNPPFSWIDS
jgi:hypothetical protein